MRALLALETATDVCSVALMQEGRVFVELGLRRPRMHAEYLVPLICDALRYGGVAPDALDAVAVSKGPGSYTGLRIGVSTAKGLAMATDARLVSVPTLEALAHTARPQAGNGDLIVAALDARRDEVYAAAFRATEGDGLAPHAETAALTEEDLPAWIGTTGARLWLVGDGATEAEAPLSGVHSGELRRLDSATHAPSAAWVARLGRERLQAGTVEDLAAFEPLYLKAFVTTPRKGTAFDRLPS